MVTFEYTNESPGAIYAGLNPGPTDSLLLACGSGDAGFAVAQSAGKITLKDRQSNQIKFSKKRANFLVNRDYCSFLKSSLPPLKPEEKPAGPNDCFLKFRDEYFSETRLKTIADKFSKEDFCSWVVGDLFSAQSSSKFNKIYLSNIVSYCNGLLLKEKDLKLLFEAVSSQLTPRGIVYLSDYHNISKSIEGNLKLFEEWGFLPNKKLTARAQELQSQENAFLVRHFPDLKGSGYNWVPIVLQKK